MKGALNSSVCEAGTLSTPGGPGWEASPWIPHKTGVISKGIIHKLDPHRRGVNLEKSIYKGENRQSELSTGWVISISSQCTSPEHPVSCIEPGLVICFIYDILHVSMPFSQIIPPSPSPTESKRLFYTSVSLAVSHTGLSLPSF